MMTSYKHILFYSDKCPYCENLLNIIKRLGTETNYKYISVDNPQIKLPEIITEVPTLIVKGMNRPLIGKEVFTWLESLQYTNLTTNNILTIKNPDFTQKIDMSLNDTGNTKDINYISLNSTDDIINKKNVSFEKINEIFITDDLNKKIMDLKIKKDLQDRKLNELLTCRTNDISNILNFNKQFVKYT